MINHEIFREYDIRGVADRDLTSPVIEALGRAFATMVQKRGISAVAVGYDARVSSPRLCNDIVRGLSSAGLDVTIIGLCPTPVLYYSLFHLDPGAGVMITGSHNPAEFNGFKLCIGKETIYGEEIQQLKRIMEERATAGTNVAQPGTVNNYSILQDYISHLKSLFTNLPQISLKVVLDSGNGTAGLAAPDILRALGCNVLELFSEPDGRFPQHHPDPTVPKNLAHLIEKVRQEKADVGIAFDGDADRIGVIDELGNILWGDQLMVIFARDILEKIPGATFVSEVKCSQTMYDAIRARGGNAIMWKTGHSLIKAKMKEVHASLAGEMSGHLFFADRYFGYDDAIYAACRVVEILKKRSSGKSWKMSQLLADLPKTFNTPEIRIDCPDAVKFRVVEQARELFLRENGLQLQPREVITVDGVRAVFDGGWGLIRASNTQPVLVMRFEGKDQAALAMIREFMEEQTRKIIDQMKR